jgi:hypothetical protein
MSSAVLKAVLSLCLVFPLLDACEEEPKRPDSRKTDAAPPGTVAGSTASDKPSSEATAASGYVEHTVQGLVLREDEDVLRIEEAKLQRVGGGDEDEVYVEAVVKGPADDRDCFLMEGHDWFATKRVIETGDVSHEPKRMESLWADELETEEFSSGDTYAEFFQEDEHPEEQAADPRKTPFFALCFKHVVPSGSERATTWYDVAHVEGTPGAS